MATIKSDSCWDMQVFAWQVCSDASQDSHRFRDIIRQHCKESGVKEHPAFAKWAKVCR